MGSFESASSGAEDPPPMPYTLNIKPLTVEKKELHKIEEEKDEAVSHVERSECASGKESTKERPAKLIMMNFGNKLADSPPPQKSDVK
jgi:hypothetical protein